MPRSMRCPTKSPPVKYPRDGGWRPTPDENKLGAWYVKTSIKGKASAASSPAAASR